MNRFIVDTNIFLRFLLKDHPKHYQLAKKHFFRAQKKEIGLILIPEVVMEINYVLRKVYSFTREETANALIKIIKSPDLEVKERVVLTEAVEKYKKKNIDLVDLFIFEIAKKEKVKVLSFDKDFKKISR